MTSCDLHVLFIIVTVEEPGGPVMTEVQVSQSDLRQCVAMVMCERARDTDDPLLHCCSFCRKGSILDRL